MKITIVAGARPNFMKIAPIIKEIQHQQTQGRCVSWRLVHTGQHFDKKMSGEFFHQLDIPEPHSNLLAGGGSQAEQTASIMIAFERELSQNKPDVVLVVGDVTSTMACAITAKKMCVDVVHVEAGIRSGDMSMPEEINRIVTDSITDHFFTTTLQACEHLYHGGVDPGRVHFVGNTMIDTLFQNLSKLKRPTFWSACSLSPGKFILLTLHRPSNVDDVENLHSTLETVVKDSHGYQVVFPVHPRTKAKIDQIGFSDSRLLQVEPLGYHEFIFLVKNCMAVITDSGGITEEATVLGVPCLTLRNSTERPETVSVGTNELVGTDPKRLGPFLKRIIAGHWKKGSIPTLWDGHTAERIVEKLFEIYAK